MFLFIYLPWYFDVSKVYGGVRLNTVLLLLLYTMWLDVSKVYGGFKLNPVLLLLLYTWISAKSMVGLY